MGTLLVRALYVEVMYLCSSCRHRKLTSTGTVRYLTHADSTVDPLASIRAQKLPA